MKDSLGDRMKTRYEDRARFFLPRRSPVIIRVDGKAFHTFTRGCDKPFDRRLMDSMDYTAKYLCEAVQGAVMAYVQSDEISLLIVDYLKRDSDAWFDYNVQKMASIASSTATAAFNHHYGFTDKGFAIFDARCFSVPDMVEVANYFIWRQKDAERNSLQMVARAHYSHKELHGKGMADLHEMLHKRGINWNDFSPREKRGGLAVRDEGGVSMITTCPIFAKTTFLRETVPVHGYEE